MKKIYLILFLINSFFNIVSYSQTFTVKPNELEFVDIFDRLVNFHLINNTLQDIILDSLKFNEDRYVVRFNENISLPWVVNSGDSLSLDIILVTYFDVTADEIHDSLLIFTNGNPTGQLLRLEIEFFEENENRGVINGNVNYAGTPIANAEVAFILDGTFVLKRTFTDSQGNYSVSLPAAEYSILASKDGYYDTYFGNSTSPFSSARVHLTSNSVISADISIKPETVTGINISGNVFDFQTQAKVGHGVIVIRKGKHTPTKRNAVIPDTANIETYSALINPDGSFSIKNILTPGYYYIQAFNNLYLPSYYTGSDQPAIFWQDADSVLIDGSNGEKNIYCKRDSSYGGGSVNGTVIFNNLAKTASDSLLNQVIIYAENINTGNIYYYSLPKKSYQFTLYNLPVGDYKLRAQIVGLDDAFSTNFTISQASPYFEGADIVFSVSPVRENNLQNPHEFIIISNYPNPFNPSTKIFVKLRTSGYTTIKSYDALGRESVEIFRGNLSKGEYTFNFDGRELAAGVYYIVVSSGNYHKVHKIMLLK